MAALCDDAVHLFDEIWCTIAGLEFDDSHVTKYENLLKFKIADGRHIENRFLAITAQPVARSQRNFA